MKNTYFQTLRTESKLSLLWVFVILNLAYADILSLMDSASPIRGIMAGKSLPAGGLLAGAILMETSIAMVVLNYLLPQKVSKWVNVVVAGVNIFAVVTGGKGSYYIFFASIETIAMLIIIWTAWSWKKEA